MYEPLPSNDMSNNAARSWRHFLVVSTGRSCGAQDEVVQRLTSWGQHQVQDVQDSDYFLCFCPISSRVGTDISEAERSVTGERPCVLVVLHHTFDRKYICCPSDGIVQNPTMVLAVDMLFHQGELLQCEKNDRALDQLSHFMRGSSSIGTFLWRHKVKLLAGVGFVGLLWLMIHSLTSP